MCSQLQYHKFWFVSILWLHRIMLSKTAENRKNPRQKYELASKPGHMVTLLLLTKQVTIMHIPTILQTTDKTEKHEIDMSWLYNQDLQTFT